MDDHLTDVLAFYDLGELLKYRRAGGFANENYFVTTSQGKYVTKFLREHTASHVDSEFTYLQRLTEHHFPAVAYIANSRGDRVYEKGDAAAVAMHRIEGAAPERSHKTTAAMGVALAQLHAVPINGLSPRVSFLDASFVDGALSELDGLVPAGDLQPYVDASRQLADFRSSLPSKTRSIIHCDFTPNNCLFQQDRLVAVIDWEEVTIGYPLLDLANAVLSTCFVDAQFDKKMFDALADAYREESGISESSSGDLEQALRWAGLTFSLWVYRHWGVGSEDPFILSNRRLYWRYGLENLELGF